MAYLLFAGKCHEELGGAEDLHGKHETIESAIADFDAKFGLSRSTWANVLCLDSMSIVKEFWCGEWREWKQPQPTPATARSAAQG